MKKVARKTNSLRPFVFVTRLVMYIPRLVMCITKLLTDITKLVIKIFLRCGKF